LLFKVAFEKAYDFVCWDYLDKAMGKMMFPNLWRKWIKKCIGTANASVLVNGSLTEEFPMERGLRQGDLLSPFLFLLVDEGFNVIMEALVANNIFTSYKVGGVDGVSISHLQFVYDSILLGENSWANVRGMRAALHIFATLSELKVNFHKVCWSGYMLVSRGFIKRLLF